MGEEQLKISEEDLNEPEQGTVLLVREILRFHAEQVDDLSNFINHLENENDRFRCEIQEKDKELAKLKGKKPRKKKAMKKKRVKKQIIPEPKQEKKEGVESENRRTEG